MKKSKWSLLLTLVLVLGVFLSACSSKGGGDNASSNGDKGGGSKKVNEPQVLNLVDSQEIPSMDSTKATDQVSFIVFDNVFEGLYRFGKDDTPVPGVAKSHEMSKDGKVYTFHLNENAKWSNGDPVTANDFVYAWRKVVDPKTAAEYAYIMAPVKNANAIMTKGNPLYGKVDKLGVEAIDEHTLKVTLEAPTPYFLGLTNFGPYLPQNEKFVKSKGDKYALEADSLVYNGPFVLSSWKHNEGWQYKKNPNYWDKDNVKLDEINVKVVKDVATAVNLYETGQIDRTGLTADFVDQYKGKEDFHTLKGNSVYFLRLNEKNPVLKNKDIRKAIDMAWDKKGLTDVILNDGSSPAYYLVPKNFTQSPDGEDFRKINGDLGEYNVDKAKEHWEKGLKAVGKKDVEIELLNYDTDNSKKVGEYLKNQLEKNLPGLKIKIKAQPFKQKLALETKMDYEMSYAGWGPDYKDPMTFIDMFVTGGSYNQMGYSNKEYDKLVNDAKKEADPKKRYEMMLKAEKILMDDQAIVPMFQNGSAYLQKPYVHDIVKHATGGDYSYKWAYIEGKK
ncbi:peptide ABC transporter substrate-binding protein [Fictibacillus gelatini]|uniref:peptide ABC transporter substrate-binding protein n=1 Tax=Fictibacillus gelatini TaxID=225985 RepID=UPI000419715E|nr:peptide ABC transporter substrate-binding protein [Fictibacillus gelatini]